jgi:lambda family phage tail tape measure protein
MATSSIEALTKLTSHTEQTTTALNILFGVLSGAAIAAAIAGMEKLTAVSLAFAATPIGRIAAIAGVVASVGTAFYLSGRQAEDAAKSYRKALDAERQRQTGGVAPLGAIKLQRPEDNQAYKDALEVQKSANKALKEAIKGEGAPMSVVATLKEYLKLSNDLVARTYKEALQEPVETVKKESVNVSNDIAKAHEMFLDATGKKVEARRLAFMRNNAEQIEKLKLAIGEGNQEAVTALMDIYGSYQAIQETEKKPKKPTSASSEGYKAALEDVKNITESIKGSVSEALGNVETLYQNNLLSIKDYFSQKKQLILTDAAVERQGIEARLQLAFAQKDRVAIEKLQGELIKSRTEETKNSTKAIQEETAALKARQDMLAGIQSEYARTFGTMVSTTDAIDAAERKYLAANGDKILQLELEVKAGNEVAEARLKELYALKDNFIIQEQLTDLETKRNELVTEYEATLQRINNQLQSGTLSPLEAGYMSDEAKDRLTTNLEDLKAKQQEVLTSQGTGIKLSDRIKREVEKSNNYLEDLKATGSRVGEGFKTVFSNSVTSAFTSFAMGTATAKQAFQSFAVSIVQGIAQIIAQEIALKAVKGVMSMFSMSFSGPAGAISTSLGNSEAFTSSMSSSNFWGSSLGSAGVQGNAKGGVYSGAGISAYSGSVVDKPTVFPFAKGTGLMGEAGPEVILPLKRNSQNELGVVSESGGQSNSNVYNIAVTVQSSKDEKPSDTGQKIAEAMMRTIAKQEIGNAARLGNSLNRTTKFG